MRITAELMYDRDLVVRAINSHFRTVVDLRFLCALVVLAASVGYLASSGDRSWFVGVLAAVFFLSVSFLGALYLHHRHSALSRFRSMGHPAVFFSANESGFALTSSLGESSLPWSAVRAISRFPGFWLLYLSRSQFINIPLVSLPEGAAEYIATRVALAGGRSGA